MSDDGSGYILRFGQLFFGLSFSVAQPSNIQIVITRFDGIAAKAPPATILALVLAFSAAIRIAAIVLLEICKVFHLQWTGLAVGGCIRPHVVDPDRLGISLVGFAALEKQNVG